MKVIIGKWPKNGSSDRKVDIRINNYDVWDYSGLAEVILAWLQKFREEPKHGYPAFLLKYGSTEIELSNGQLSFDFYKKTDPGDDYNADEWMKIIDKMIWSFNEVINSPNGDCYYDQIGEIDWDTSLANPDVDGIRTMRWKVEPILNRHKMIQYEEKIQEGLDLFAKHFRDFRDLWD